MPNKIICFGMKLRHVVKQEWIRSKNQLRVQKRTSKKTTFSNWKNSATQSPTKQLMTNTFQNVTGRIVKKIAIDSRKQICAQRQERILLWEKKFGKNGRDNKDY